MLRAWHFPLRRFIFTPRPISLRAKSMTFFIEEVQIYALSYFFRCKERDIFHWRGSYLRPSYLFTCKERDIFHWGGSHLYPVPWVGWVLDSPRMTTVARFLVMPVILLFSTTLCVPGPDQKSGYWLLFKWYLDSLNQPVTLEMSIHGHHINILFSMGAAVFYHRDHMRDFINSYFAVCAGQKSRLLCIQIHE